MTEPKSTLSAAKATAYQSVNTQFDAIMRNRTGGASVEERDTWKTKEEAARDFLAGDATPAQTQMIVIEAQFRGVEPAALAQTVVAKSDGYRVLIGMAAGIKAKAHAAIDAAKTEAQLAAVGVTAQQDIAAALAQLNG